MRFRGVPSADCSPAPRPAAGAARRMVCVVAACLLGGGLAAARATSAIAEVLPRDDGFRGIWYSNQPSEDEYRFKYSGGMGTYPQQHIPIAIYSAAAGKTFFVYGGTTARRAGDPQTLLHMISYFDHVTGQVARPRILLNKETSDAHDNPVLALDEGGHLWIFSPSHGTSRPSFIHRSVRPYDIDEFEKILETNFSYPQPWRVANHGFVFLHTRYGGADLTVHAARTLAAQTSVDGRDWSRPQGLAGILNGNYQISWARNGRLATAFDHHPPPRGLNQRSNIYYLQTDDGGQTWTLADGTPLAVPLTAADNPARIYDSVSQNRLVYLKDLNFDAYGHPSILFLTSGGYEAGPANDPREWQVISWTGENWELSSVITTSDNNYDHGSLYLESEDDWRVIAPTIAGPQRGNPGGEMAMWVSQDRGGSWRLERQLTRESDRNHSYARRPVDAHPDFYAFWADGHGRQPSTSRLYFTNQEGTQVWRLPEKMTEEFARPEIAW